ncbi:uncharacterized protein At2g39910 isoform X2 [Magnolia sinica]|uniref:uncharacterized protein At2g39910 isoform X2 n=1 Tax=Magnolia sinica TaxID=86752 RepID=UPI0026590274|nr:uncharacterized protein At2g39910 isoform X2 [Magnolia sinica]
MSMADSMASSSSISQVLIRLSGPIRETLEITPYTPPDGPNISIKSNLLSLLPPNRRESIRVEIRDFCLCCAALASAASLDSGPISWIPRPLSAAANSAVAELSEAVYRGSDGDGLIGAGDSDAHFSLAPKESRLVGELMPDVLPLLTGVIKESSIGSEDDDEIAAASARAPVAEAIVAAHQFRWFVTQVNYPYLGKVCNLVLPCALTALDHWSPEVKGQGMVSLIHLAKNVNAAELGWYEDVVLDACCRNIASSDELWHYVVEMSVLLVTCIQRRNPRSPWFERMLSEMLGHLERQPKNKQRCMSWLQLIEPLFNAMGLVLLAHFRRIFPLFFKWMHVDDDETVLLVRSSISSTQL